MNINVKDMNLDNVSYMQQIEKLREEYQEFVQEIVKTGLDDTESNGYKEELCDLIRAALGVAQVQLGLSIADIVSYWNIEHCKKIESRGYKPR